MKLNFKAFNSFEDETEYTIGANGGALILSIPLRMKQSREVKREGKISVLSIPLRMKRS